MLAIRESGGGWAFNVLVSPRASKCKLGPIHDGRLKVSVTAAPVEGAANRAVTQAIATALHIARRHVTVTHGTGSRRKPVRVVGASRDAIQQLAGVQSAGPE